MAGDSHDRRGRRDPCVVDRRPRARRYRRGLGIKPRNREHADRDAPVAIPPCAPGPRRLSAPRARLCLSPHRVGAEAPYPPRRLDREAYSPAIRYAHTDPAKFSDGFGAGRNALQPCVAYPTVASEICWRCADGIATNTSRPTNSHSRVSATLNVATVGLTPLAHADLIPPRPPACWPLGRSRT